MSQDFISKRDQWASRIDQWRQSRKSAKAWCRENQVIYTTFIGWRDRLTHSTHRKNIPAPPPQHPKVFSLNIAEHFIELKELPRLNNPGVFLEYAGVTIHLAADFDVATLRKCFSILRGNLC